MFTKGKFDEELYFNNGSKKIIRNIIKAEQGNWFHYLDTDGNEWIINPLNVLYVRVRNQIITERNGKK